MKIAIAGATGFVGTALTLKLLDQDHQITALSRKPGNWPIQHHNLKTIKGDITQSECLSSLLEGQDVAFYLVHGLAQNDQDFEHYEAKYALHFVKMATKAKIKKIIYLSGLGPEGECSAHLRSRHLTGSILGIGPVPCVEFRASIILGAQSLSFEMIKALAQRLPVRPYTSLIETQCQPIGLADLIDYLVAALDIKVVGHQVVEIGAPQVVAYGDLLDHMIKLEGIIRPKFLLPQIDQRILLPLLDLLVPEFSEIGKKLISSLEYPTVVTDKKAEELFPEICPMGLEEAMAQAHAESKSHYPAVWEGDFWKELKDQTLMQTKQGQQILMDKIKHLAEIQQSKTVAKLAHWHVFSGLKDRWIRRKKKKKNVGSKK